MDGSAANCPRCGYDQRGVIATWSDQCPLQGTCSECGLNFNWSEVMMPAKFEPRWCVEFSRGFIRLPWRSCTTLWNTFAPWRFWRDLRMSHEPRWRNLAAYLGVWVTVIYVLFAFTQALVAWRSWHAWTLGSTPVTGTQPLQASLHALLLPFSSASPGNITDSWGLATPLPSPRELASSYGYGTTTMFLTPLVISLTVIVSATTFAVLPQSRRQAKVKWMHIARILFYGLVLPMPVIAMMPIAAYFAEHGWFVVIANAAAMTGLAIIGFQYVWWSFACQRYLRMRSPWAVGAAVWIVGVLATAIIVLSIEA